MKPGTIVQAGGLILRRRPYATIGLPWKSKLGARYEHVEIDLMLDDGATVTFCGTCAAGALCLPHDIAHLGTAPQLSDGAP